MHKIWLIGIGSGVGGILRYALSNGVYLLTGKNFPYGTLVVNATGCFLIGFLFSFLLDRFDGLGEQLRALLLIGFLGGYTTFSTFTIETMNLFESGYMLRAFLNVLVSVTVCLGLTAIGMILGRE